MSVDTETAEVPETEAKDESKEGQKPQDNSPEKSDTFDREYVEKLRAEAAANRKARSALEEKVQKFEDASKTETEKLTAKAAKLGSEKERLEAENLKLRVAIKKNLPADLYNRLQGSSEEEIEADADSLLKLVQANERDSAEFDGGAREETPEPTSPEEAHQRLLMERLGLKPQ